MNLPVCTFISVYVYTSLVFSFVCYTGLYNIFEIIYYNFIDTSYSISISTAAVITVFTIYCSLGVLLMTYRKDIIFAVLLEYLLAAYLCMGNEINSKELTAAILLIIFNFLAIILTVIKHGRTTFGYEEDTELNSYLIASKLNRKSIISQAISSL